jgi:hypothetical protein
MSAKMKQANIECKCTGAGGDDIFDGYEMTIEALGEGAKDGNSGMLAFAYLYRRFGPPFCGSDNYKDICAYELTTDDPKVFLWIHPKASGLPYSIGYLAAEELREERMKPLYDYNAKWEEWWLKRNGINPDEFNDLPKKRKETLSSRFCRDRHKIKLIGLANAELGPPPYPGRSDKNWKEDPDSVRYRVNIAVFNALKELLRPVYVRDVPINILGRCGSERSLGFRRPAKESKYAGFGIPRKAMDDWIKDD